MENMYKGKSSKNPNTTLIWGVIIGVGLIVFSVIMYYDLAAWENSNDEKQLNSLLWLIYDAGGKLGVSAFFIIGGFIAVGVGYKKTKNLKEIQNSVNHSKRRS